MSCSSVQPCGLCANCEALKQVANEHEVLETIRKWKFHWLTKEPGYFNRAFHVDSNMMHHLAKMITTELNEPREVLTYDNTGEKTVLQKIEEYSNRGFDVTIEVGGGKYVPHMTKEMKENVEDFGTYYVNLYYGDSNSPWKPGTLDGTGRGFTLEEAFNAAEANLKHPTEKNEKD